MAKVARTNISASIKVSGWVSVDCLQCYIIHSESFDIYVLSSQSPVIQ